ncbi:MAG: rhodanese-like domain-containing protein [Vicingaceae bacterium]
MKQLIICIFFIVTGLGAFAQNYDSFEDLKENIVSKTVPLITAEELKKVENTKASLLIIDAREQNEFNASHIKNSKYVGYDNFKMKSLKGIDKETTVVVYCSVGYRSEKIGEKLKKAGFKKVLNLYGGIFDWVNKGFPVYDRAGNKTNKVHAYDKSWGKWLTKGEKVYE